MKYTGGLFLLGIIVLSGALMIPPVFAIPLPNETPIPAMHTSYTIPNPSGGTFVYWRNITPQNDIYEKVVYPGDTIVLGRNYDLRNVAGTSQNFAWWDNESAQGTDCDPDQLTTINYVDTQGRIHPDDVFIDPVLWRVGDWFQWEGCYMLPYEKDQEKPRYSPYHQDNNLVFHVIEDPHPLTMITITTPPTPTPDPTTRIPPVHIPTPAPTPAPVIDEGMPWYYWLLIVIGVVIILDLLW